MDLDKFIFKLMWERKRYGMCNIILEEKNVVLGFWSLYGERRFLFITVLE